VARSDLFLIFLFHREGFSTFHLRGKTYGNVFRFAQGGGDFCEVRGAKSSGAVAWGNAKPFRNSFPADGRGALSRKSKPKCSESGPMLGCVRDAQ
jgi:hypothetical protein